MKDIEIIQELKSAVKNKRKVPGLSKFFIAIDDDRNISMPHVCIYLSLFYIWYSSDFQNPVQITRSQIMGLAKIGGIATYHRCMKDLHNLGFIKYFPSFHPSNGSRVYMMDA